MPFVEDIVGWIKAASASDERAWNHLYNRFYPSLLTTAFRICGDLPASRDAVQETFVIAFVRIGQLKEPKAFGAWLKTILIHTCYRLKSRASETPLSALSDNEKDVVIENAEELHVQSWQQTRLSASISRLPEKLSIVLMLRYYSNFHSYQEIARILSIPVGTVRSRLSEAKSKLVQHWLSASVDETFPGTNDHWNAFYTDAFFGMHHHDDQKNRFLKHLNHDISVLIGGNRRESGKKAVDQLVADDRQAGSWFRPFSVHTQGNVSLIEVHHYNSAENPSRCPSSSVTVLVREQHKASRLYLYLPTK